MGAILGVSGRKRRRRCHAHEVPLSALLLRDGLRRWQVRLLASAYGLSALGDLLALVTLTLRVHNQGGSGSAVAGLLVAGVLPVVVVGPLAGPMVDRLETRRLLMVLTLAQVAAAAALALTTGYAATVLLVVALAALAAVVNPALLALVPALVGEERSSQGYAALETGRTTGSALGPVLAGVLVAAAGARSALLVDAATFLVLAGTLALLPVRRRAATGGGRPSWLGQVREGSSALRRDPALRAAVPALAAAVLFVTITNTAIVFYSAQALHAGDTGYGVLVTSQMLGQLFGASLIVPRLAERRLPRRLGLAGVVMGAALTGLAVFPALPSAVLLLFVSGLCNAVQNLTLRSLIRKRVPDERRGRVFATTSAVLNAANLAGTGLGGPLVSATSGSGAVLTSGLGALAVSLAALPALRRASSS